uniref:Spd B1 protein n=1 Tax=Streptomyces castaneoglobisporus TaxID=79261 RepID=O83013_9ACTN|nr:spd B1 [Streptomyces castaneoglobisporus]
MQKRSTAAPAVAMTAVSMVLTLAVVVMWLGGSMPWPVALVVGLGIDGGWLATLAYDRHRLGVRRGRDRRPGRPRAGRGLARPVAGRRLAPARG